MKKLIYFLLMILITESSCKKYLDINKNPNQPTDVEPTFVLSQSLAASGFIQAINYYVGLSQWMGYTARSAGFAPNSAFEAFEITQGQFQANWTNVYHLIYDLNFVESRSAERKQPFFEGAAKALKAFWFQYLVDMFNNVPYTDAAQPAVIQNPKYDDAKTIYEDLIKQLDQAIILLKSSGSLSPADAKYDVMFFGDKTHWIKFANTVKLRVLIRQSEMAGRAAYIQTEISKITAEGTGFINEGDDALINPGFENSPGKQSYIYGNYGLTPNGTPATTFFRAHQFAVDFHKNTNDPRIDFIYKKPANGVHLGNWLGSSPNANSITSETGPGVIKTGEAPFPFFLATESLFLQAEAVQRGYMTGNAKSLYQRAITASFKYLGVTSADAAAATYYSQAGIVNVSWDDSPDKIQAIAMQKWAAMNGLNAMEAWAEFRRTGYPRIIPASLSPNVTKNQIPARGLYPQVEYDVNPENVLAQGTISQFDSKIFWMK
jgi:hypothetical protein